MSAQNTTKDAKHVTNPEIFFSTGQSTISGLHFIQHFIDIQTQSELLSNSSHLYSQNLTEAKLREPQKAQTYLSKQHNLKTEEYYKLLYLQSEKGKNLTA